VAWIMCATIKQTLDTYQKHMNYINYVLHSGVQMSGDTSKNAVVHLFIHVYLIKAVALFTLFK